MDHYADDLAALTAYLDLKAAVHVGHSTGGGEVAHYLARHGESRVAGAVLVSAVPPLMVQTAANPGGLPKETFDSMQAERRQSLELLRRPGIRAVLRIQPAGSHAISGHHLELVASGMTGGAKAHYDGIVAFSQTDFTDDLKEINVPVLVMHGDDDQIVPYADSAPLSAKLLRNGTLRTYKGFPHGMPTTEAETINRDILAFIGQFATSPTVFQNPPSPREAQLQLLDEGVHMSTLHFHQTTSSTPEQFLAALIDFGPGRSKVFGNSADDYLKVTAEACRMPTSPKALAVSGNACTTTGPIPTGWS